MHLPTNTVFFSLKGATLKKDEQTGAIVVARIMRGGAADRSGERAHVWRVWASHAGFMGHISGT